MKIANFNVENSKINNSINTKRNLTQDINNENDKTITQLGVYPRPYFGSSQVSLKEFNLQNLPNVSIDEEFDKDELRPPNGGVNVQSILNLTYSYMSEQIRHLEQTGELIPYKKQQIIDEASYKGLSDNEIQAELDKAKSDFNVYVENEKQNACESIDSLSPTKTEHTVYRIINDSPDDITKKYFSNLRRTKEGDEIVLDSTPVYVSTSAKKTMANYGNTGANNGILFEIKLPKGSKLFKFPSNDGIEQCIMKPDAKFKVLENKQYKNNFNVIKLEYILD